MSTPMNREVIAQGRDEPAPLLALLHAFHDRDGFISEAVLRDIAVGLRIPLAELFGTVTFYHHLRVKPQDKAHRASVPDPFAVCKVDWKSLTDSRQKVRPRCRVLADATIVCRC